MKKLIIAAAIIAAVGIGGVCYANYAVTQEVKKEVDRQLVMLSEQSFINATYDSISASIFNSSVELAGVSIASINDEPIAAAKRIEVVGYEPNKIAAYSEFTLEQFKFSDEFVADLPANANNQLAQASYDLHTQMDYDQTSGDTEIAMQLDANEIAQFKFDIGLAKATALMNASLKMGEIQQAAAGKELTMEQQLQVQTLMMQAMNELEPRTIEFGVNNQGQFKTVVEEALNEQGLTLEQMQQLVSEKLKQIAVSEELSEAVTNFSKGLNSFSVSASLPEGQTMAQINQQIMILMGQPEKLAEFINLEAKGD